MPVCVMNVCAVRTSEINLSEKTKINDWKYWSICILFQDFGVKRTRTVLSVHNIRLKFKGWTHSWE